MMDSHQLSLLSSLRAEPRPEDYVQPHYKEGYRLAIDALAISGRESYQEVLKAERLGSFLSGHELLFITNNVLQPLDGNDTEETSGSLDGGSSSGTYWPVHSDVETPDLELGWPDLPPERRQTSIDLLFHPPRLNSPTIKEVVRKHIQDARQLIAVVMDVFTDVDIFKEAVDASLRGVSVYVLLDHLHLHSFLSMAESQDVHIHKLRNMRVRSVKGQDYLCRSGATFHGALQQRFLLVDCETVMFGSYSFTWSFEKIHLSMVQVITGRLVGSYDEEFRTLYARSRVPAALCPPGGSRQAPAACQPFARRDVLRHTLDTVYRKACEGQLGVRDVCEGEPFEQRPPAMFVPGVGVQGRIQQLQTQDTDFLKRHSYAGERQERPYVPQNPRFGSSNWNVAGDAGYHPNGRIQFPNDQRQPENQMFRGLNTRQSYHGNDKQIVSMKQNMPSLENTSRSFLRTWRIDSYLNNSDAPCGESSDYLDQYEPLPENKAGHYMPSRLRSSFVFKSTIPEQPESNSYTTSSSSSRPPPPTTVPFPSAPYYNPTQWSPAEGGARLEEFQLKRRSLQILDDPRGHGGLSPVRGSHHSIYASLGRAKGGLPGRNADPSQESWHKRHSVAESNTDYRDHQENSSHMYGFARTQAERSTPGFRPLNGGCAPNLHKDQRSVSHHDVKSVTAAKSQPVTMWQNAPSRTVSVAALDVDAKETANPTSPRFLKKSSKKLRSLLNIPEKKEGSKDRGSPGPGSRTDTVLSEAEQRWSDRDQRSPIPSPSRLHVNKNHPAHVGNSSAPRFSTEELPCSPSDKEPAPRAPRPGSEDTARTHLPSGDWRSQSQRADGRLYSRFEPFCAFDKKPSSPSVSTNTHAQGQPKTTLLSKGGSPSEPHNRHGQATHGQHENKLGKFIQRVGNFIHKNK
ncbi:protein FAM83B [Osmerus mordax]|uniref:protein FAM83B n=1 Tax=Osmerus mordax TaxID=8014 RepID=UPI00350E935C